jgi:hypothetical protein
MPFERWGLGGGTLHSSTPLSHGACVGQCHFHKFKKIIYQGAKKFKEFTNFLLLVCLIRWYNGGVDSLEVDQTDVLELMAAANFFQLEGLLRFCEAQCALLVDLDNIVSMYIHAKVFILFFY